MNEFNTLSLWNVMAEASPAIHPGENPLGGSVQL